MLLLPGVPGSACQEAGRRMTSRGSAYSRKSPRELQLPPPQEGRRVPGSPLGRAEVTVWAPHRDGIGARNFHRAQNTGNSLASTVPMLFVISAIV